MIRETVDRFGQIDVLVNDAARVGQPTDIAKAILFPASEEASYIMGETIHVDGGNRLLE